MKRICALLLFILTTACIGAQPATQDKTSPLAKMSPLVRLAACTSQAQSRRAGGSSSLLTAFVQTRLQQSDTLFGHYGCRKYAQLDDIAIVTIPCNQIASLARHPAVLRIEAGRTAQALMDTMSVVSNIQPIYTATSQHQAYTGDGVIVGLMDVGFDLSHPNFYSDTQLSRYRIMALWDQLSQDTIGSAFPVGRDFVGPDAVLDRQHSVDGRTETHGTHTLGIAAGSGYDTPYRGVAFDSDICLVSNAVTSDTIYIDPADYYKYTTATDALGFKYLFDYADSQGKPCVASFSEGSTPYADQEDSLYSAFLDKLSGPGHIICVAAGNENQELTYAEKPRGVAEGGAFVRCFRTTAQYVVKGDGPFTLSLYAYRSGSAPTDTLRLASTDQRLDSVLTDTLFLQNDTCVVYATRYPSAFEPTETLCVLQLLTNRSMNFLPALALVAEGVDSRVAIHGSSTSALTTAPADPRWDAASPGHNILSPAMFPSVICVGGTYHRQSYTNLNGQLMGTTTPQVKGKRMASSSTGPALNGLMKPDVTAPGYNVLSSFSSYYETAPDDWIHNTMVARSECQGRAYHWFSNSGTSMSCPVVAGVIALWLQACPSLTRDDVMGVFSRTCSHPDETLTYPNNLYGYGDIDAYRGLLDILGLTSVSDISLHQPASVSIRPVHGGLSLTFGDVPASPVSVSLYRVDGTLMERHRVTPTSREVTLPLSSLPTGVCAVQVSSRERRFTGSQLVRW